MNEGKFKQAVVLAQKIAEVEEVLKRLDSISKTAKDNMVLLQKGVGQVPIPVEFATTTLTAVTNLYATQLADLKEQFKDL